MKLDGYKKLITPPDRERTPLRGMSPTPLRGMSALSEYPRLIKIAFPSMFINIFSFLLWTQTAASVGHETGSDAVSDLAGFAMASFVANVSCQSIMVGSLSASDTFSPQAYGAGNYGEIGNLAIRGYVVTLVLLLPFAVLMWNSEDLLVFFGQDAHVSYLATWWIRHFLIAIPFMLLTNVIQRFLTSQEVVMPLFYCGIITCFVVHPINLRIFVHSLGFIGSVVSMILSQMVQAMLLLLYIKWKHPYKIGTSSEYTFSKALNLTSIKYFLQLGFGGILSLSEWWFWEAICFVAGKFGVQALGVHTVAYQLVPIFYLMPYGISVGLCVRLGSILATDVERAKRLVLGCVVFSVLLCAIMAVLVHRFRRVIVGYITDDQEIQAGCSAIWNHVSCFLFLDGLFAINGGIMRALGLQWKMGLNMVVVLWILSLPCVYYFSIVQNGGLEVLWECMPPVYVALNFALMWAYCRADWKKISLEIREREGLDKSAMALPREKTYGTVSTG